MHPVIGDTFRSDLLGADLQFLEFGGQFEVEHEGHLRAWTVANRASLQRIQRGVAVHGLTREQTLAINANVIETFRANGGEMPEGIRCTATPHSW